MVNETATPKAKKAKGPIRFEAIIPCLIIFALVYFYFLLFFDTHLRKGLEFAGSRGNGAEVNIQNLSTSFWKASLDIHKIEITNPEKPTHNSLVIGDVRWQMLWDALLRGKIVISEASVLGIQVDQARKSPGFVIPPPPPDKESSDGGLKAKALAAAEAEFKQNIFGDIAGLLGGGNVGDQLKSIEGTLKSSARIQEIQAALKDKEKEWQERLSKLPQGKDIQAIGDRVKTVKLSGFSNPMEVQQSIQQLDGIYRELDGKIKEAQGTTSAVQGDLNAYQNVFKEIESLVQQDLKDLEARLKIPKIDAQSLVRVLFGPELLAKLRKGEHYMNLSRKYMPPKKTAEEKAEYKVVARKRSEGINYKFGRPNSYPLFWLKIAKISSVASADGTMGDMKGALIDLTDDQPTLGRPTRLTFAGDFPAQQLSKVSGELIIDHRTEHPIETLSLNVGAFPVGSKMFADTSDVQFGFKEAAGSSQLKVKLSGEEIELTSFTLFQNIAYIVSAKQENLDQILKGAVDDIKKVTVESRIQGKWSSPTFSLNSNLGNELQKAFEKQLQVQVQAAKQKIQKLIDEQIGPKKAELTSQFNKIKDQVSGVLKQKEGEVNKAKGQIESAKTEATNSGSKKAEEEGKKVLDDLKNKFKF